MVGEGPLLSSSPNNDDLPPPPNDGPIPPPNNDSPPPPDDTNIQQTQTSDKMAEPPSAGVEIDDVHKHELLAQIGTPFRKPPC